MNNQLNFFNLMIIMEKFPQFVRLSSPVTFCPRDIAAVAIVLKRRSLFVECIF
jgi:hypothetical protein